MTFSPGDGVLWKGEPCRVELARGEMVVLLRDRDGFTIITNTAELATHQPTVTAPPSRSLIGGV